MGVLCYLPSMQTTTSHNVKLHNNLRFFFLVKSVRKLWTRLENHFLGFLCFFMNPTFCLFGLVGFLVLSRSFAWRASLLAFHSSHLVISSARASQLLDNQAICLSLSATIRSRSSIILSLSSICFKRGG